MKKILKPVLAGLLAVCLLCSTFVTPAFSFGQTNLPTVYVLGFGAAIVERAGDADSEWYFPKALPEDFAQTVISDVKGPFLKGLAGNWDDFHQYVIDTVVGIFGKIAPDHNGDVTDGSGIIRQDYSVAPCPGRTSFSTADFIFEYDWRLDPMALAVKLHDYIEQVKAATGYDKVNLIGRCLGNNLLLAYLEQFGYDSVERVLFYSAGFDGFEFFGSLFSGSLFIDANEAQSYLDTVGRETLLQDDPQTLQMLITLVKILNATDLLDVAALALNAYFVPEFQDFILPEVLRKSFGACPSMWSFVGDDVYEKAKQYVFGGQETEWSGLIERIDRYHYEVMCNTRQIIETAISRGVKVYVFAKYGLGMLPLTEDYGENGDGLITVKNSSLGATVAPMYLTLSDSYLRQQQERDGGRYLDPAHQVDASTCMLPDHTWFLRGIYHSTNPESVEQLIAQLLRSDEYVTVFDDENYPQFLLWEKETDTLRPITEKDQPTFAERILVFWKVFPRMINKLVFRIRTSLRG